MSLAELQKFTAISKYAQFRPELGRREIYTESVERVENMWLGLFPEHEGMIREAYAAQKRMEVLGSQRVLQFGGKDILKHNLKTYNCASSYIDRLDFYRQAFYALLCGTGVGFSVQHCHIKYLPNYSQARLTGRLLSSRIHVVEDSIEGWANSHAALISGFFEKPIKGFEQYRDCDVLFDYSKIRDKGSPLSHGIGKAPGPDPLRISHEKCVELLTREALMGNPRMRSITSYDYLMFLADATVAGGIRRAATLCLFDVFDEDMIAAKTGDWFIKNPQRGRSNNSATLIRGQVTREQFANLFSSARQFGEPGTYWADSQDELPNPCVEIGLFDRLIVAKDFPKLAKLLASYDGPIVPWENDCVALSGFQMCNLSTINGKTVVSKEDFYKRCKHAAVMGTLQASLTHFPFMGQVTEEITRREALLGVSIGGIMHNPHILLDPEILREGAKVVRETNEEVASLIGINPAARLTCVKPDGNSASLMGSFPGCHAGKIRKGFRIAQVNKSEEPYKHFRKFNAFAAEHSVWNQNGTDDCIRFPVKFEGIVESETTAKQMLDNVKLLKRYWVDSGKVAERCVQPYSSHNVSNTVAVKEDEWDIVEQDIFDHQDLYAGISVLSWSGDKDYAQAPFTAVLTPSEQVERYGEEAVEKGKSVVYAANMAFPQAAGLWTASDVAVFGAAPDASPEVHQWLDTFNEFASSFDSRKTATYCLKDIHNWDLYEVISSSFVPVDYTKMVETEDNTDLTGEVACAGGACLI